MVLPPLPVKTFQAKLSKLVVETPDTKTLCFDVPTPEFRPGQFYMVQTELKERNGFQVQGGKPKVQKRAYSVASSPTEKGLEFIVKGEPDGFVSKYLAETAVEGDDFTLSGPYGHFVFLEGTTENVVLIGAGSGIAPLRCIAKYCLDKKLPVNTVFFFSNKTPEDVIRGKEMETWNSPNFKLVNTLTRYDGSDWEGEKGRIDAEMIRRHYQKGLNEALYFLCGPPLFVTSMRELLYSMGVEKERVKVEIYG